MNTPWNLKLGFPLSKVLPHKTDSQTQVVLFPSSSKVIWSNLPTSHQYRILNNFFKVLHYDISRKMHCKHLLATVFMDLWFIRNAHDAGKSITMARGVGHLKLRMFARWEMASSLQTSAIWCPKKTRFPGPKPPPTCPSNGFARIKSITYRAVWIRGPYLCTIVHELSRVT